MAPWDLQTRCCFSGRRASGTAHASGCRKTQVHLGSNSPAGTLQMLNNFCTSTWGFLPNKWGVSALLWSQTSFRSYFLRVACLSPTMQEVKKEYSWIHTFKMFPAKPWGRPKAIWLCHIFGPYSRTDYFPYLLPQTLPNGLARFFFLNLVSYFKLVGISITKCSF